MVQTISQIPPPQEQEFQENHHQVDEIQEFTCEFCVERTSNSVNNYQCSHPFCTDCVINYIRVQLEDNNVGDIKCPALNCDQTLDPVACASLVGPSLFVRWCDVLCESAILGFGKCYCPHRECNALIVNECGGKVKKSECPNCKSLFCFECKSVWHDGFGCEESVETRDRNDVAFWRLVEQKKLRRCPGCGYYVELTDGCLIVKCRCGISFCFSCQVQADCRWCRCMNSPLHGRYDWCYTIFGILVFFSILSLVLWQLALIY